MYDNFDLSELSCVVRGGDNIPTLKVLDSDPTGEAENIFSGEII